MRIVLCKKLIPAPGFLVFFTNYDSRKGAELAANPRASAVFHWDAFGRQVRVEGPIVRSPADESDEYFASRALDSRIGAWASLQSQPLDARRTLLKRVAVEAARFGTSVPRPPHWGGYRLWPESVELWIEGPFRVHDRARWTRSLVPAGDDGFAPGPGRRRDCSPEGVAERTFFGTLRIAILLAVLVFVALGAWLDKRRSTDWDSTLRVTVYPIAAGTDAATTRLRGLAGGSGLRRARGLLRERGPPPRRRTRRTGAGAAVARGTGPAACGAVGSGTLSVAAWSLRFRYWASRVAANDPLPTPDVQVFALYHAPDGGQAVPDSLGLSKGLMAVTHLYADPRRPRQQSRRPRARVAAHARRDRQVRGRHRAAARSGRPRRSRSSRRAIRNATGEIMAGRIAVNASEAVIPDGLQQMVVGPATAREIGWAK